MKKTTSLLSLTALATLAAPAVQADSLLFPVLTRSPSVATIISVVNKDPQGVLNVNYFTKAPDLTTPCIDEGVRQITGSGRANDMVSFDASGNFLAPNGGPLFNDPATLVPYGNVDFSMSNNGVARGFLIVDDGDNTSEGNSGGDLYGEALILEIAGGAAFGYRAYNPILDFAFADAPNGIPGPVFGHPGGLNSFLGEVLDPNITTQNGTLNVGNAATTLLPPNEWTTRFFVTPVANGLRSAASQRDCEQCSVSIYFSPDKAGTLAGVIDRDTVQRAEPFAPAALPTAAKNIVCTGAVGLTEILPQAVVNQIANQGGWGYVQIRPGTSNLVESAATVMKLEFNLVNGSTTTRISPDNSTTFTGTVNSAVWLRNNGIPGTSGF